MEEYVKHSNDPCQGFCRSAYYSCVQEQEKVHVVVLSTFRLDLKQLHLEFPHVFNEKCSIPTLVLHGDKDSFATRTACDDHHLNTITEKVVDLPPLVYDSDDEYLLHYKTQRSQKSLSFQYNNNVRICEVLPQWPSPPSSCGSAHTASRAIAGVHHPKYMLIFTDRGLHVSISTANLTVPHSVDITWCQFFPLTSVHPQNPDSAAEQGSEVGSDFGAVLEDFLCQVALQW